MNAEFLSKIAKITLLTLGLLVYGFSEAQVISGKVVDEKTGESLPFANVFINNTTLGSTTDINGNFRISGSLPQNPEVVASFVGYFTKYRKVAFGGRNQVTVNFELTPKEDQLDEVSLSAKRDKAWERNLRKFERVFLAVPDDPFFKKNEILNPWVIDFQEGKAEGLGRYLAASSSEPVTVANRALGYEIDYHLQEYLQTKNGFQYYGLVNFKEIENPENGTESAWDEYRNSAYYGSMRHLLHALVRNEADSQGFEAFIVQDIAPSLRTNDFDKEIGSSLLPLPLDSLVTAILPNGNFIMEWPGNVEVHFTKKYWPSTYYTNRSHPISWIEAPNCKFEVDANGVMMDPRELVLSGHVARERVARLLPHDFRPDLQDLKLLAEVDSIQFDLTKWNNLRERPYVTLNKSYYYPGETIWMQTHMLYQNSIFADTLSRAVYIDLVNEKMETIKSASFFVNKEKAEGQLILEDDFPEGKYALVAYTNWMRNYLNTPHTIKYINILPKGKWPVINKELIDVDQEADIDVGFSIEPSFEILKKGLNSTVKFNVLVKDEYDMPVKSALSLSLLDANYGEFLPDTDLLEALDWVNDDSEPLPDDLFKIEYGLSIEGQYLTAKNQEKSVPITVVVGEMEDFGVIRSDSLGRFYATGIHFYDSAEVAIAALSDKLKRKGKVELISANRPNHNFEFDTTRIPLVEMSTSSMWFDKYSGEKIIDLSEVSVLDQKILTTEENNYGYGPGDRSVSREFLDQYPDQTAGAIVNMVTGGGVLKRQNWGLSTGEPLLMIDGVRYLPHGISTVAEQLDILMSSDVESIEIYTLSATQFGSEAFAGAISIKTRKGSKTAVRAPNEFNKSEFQLFKVMGFTKPIPFPAAGEMGEVVLPKPTLYWNPSAVTSEENGAFQFEIAVPSNTNIVYLKVEGVNQDGFPFRKVFEMGLSAH
ncbi:carboxypeptidase-like regulatory domain-containing protein [Cognataquiflexum rubidum]|uniref:carboxypeptidase-like regulatory domain-containing protein n=1 Tax=Cognataquiflexum rubidum TaxID=2922273 RepID=UPI001F13C80B|nr:TonB-dependent receptor [Cognataquiflexum rubidum]MCH6236610.1 TonB-dependent receptor [Cognataquiflexum rubidum]